MNTTKCLYTYAIRSSCTISKRWEDSHNYGELLALVSKNYRRLEGLLFGRLAELQLSCGFPIEREGDILLHCRTDQIGRHQLAYMRIASHAELEHSLLVVNYEALDSCALDDLWDSMEEANAVVR